MNSIWLILLVGAVVLFVLMNVLYRHLDDSQEAHILRAKKGRWDMVCFGSSYCRYAFDFEDTGVNGYNLGFVAQFFYYTKKMLQCYSPFFRKNCYVILVIVNLVFAREGRNEYGGANKYRRILNRKSLGDDFSLVKYICSLFPLLENPKCIKHLLKLLFYKIVYKNPLPSPENVDFNPHTINQVKNDALQRCAGWCGLFGLKDTLSSDIPDDMSDIFKKTQEMLTGMIQYCLENGYKPVLVVTPVSRHLNDLFSDEFLEKVLYENIREANMQGVPFLDYLKDERFQDEKYYLNADCLNHEGRRKFTKIVIEDIQKLKY